MQHHTHTDALSARARHTRYTHARDNGLRRVCCGCKVSSERRVRHLKRYFICFYFHISLLYTLVYVYAQLGSMLMYIACVRGYLASFIVVVDAYRMYIYDRLYIWYFLGLHIAVWIFKVQRGAIPPVSHSPGHVYAYTI